MTRHALTPAQAAIKWLACEDLDRSPHREQFAAWLEESEENRQAWAQAHRMWDVFDEAESNDLIAALARAARKARPEPAIKPYWPALVAASIAALAVSAVPVVQLRALLLVVAQRPVPAEPPVLAYLVVDSALLPDLLSRRSFSAAMARSSPLLGERTYERASRSR